MRVVSRSLGEADKRDLQAPGAYQALHLSRDRRRSKNCAYIQKGQADRALDGGIDEPCTALDARHWVHRLLSLRCILSRSAFGRVRILFLMLHCKFCSLLKHTLYTIYDATCGPYMHLNCLAFPNKVSYNIC